VKNNLIKLILDYRFNSSPQSFQCTNSKLLDLAYTLSIKINFLGPVYLSWLIFVRDKSVLIAARGVQLSHSK